MANKIIQVENDTPIAMLTVGQLKAVLNSILEGREANKKDIPRPSPKRYEHGISGIRRIFNCSYPTAHKLKEGIIKPAISQQGRVMKV